MYRDRASRQSLVRWEQILNRPEVSSSHYSPLKFNTELDSTADADPGGGFFVFNHATQSSATELYFSELETSGDSVENLLDTFPATGYIYMQEAVNTNIWQWWKWTAIESATGYRKFTAEYLDGSGSFLDDVAVYVDFKPSGDGGGGGGPSTATTGYELVYTSHTATADADPVDQHFHWNAGTQASATYLYFDTVTADGVTVTNILDSIGGCGHIYLVQIDDPTRWQTWKWKGIAPTGLGSYRKWFVALLANSTNPIEYSKAVSVRFETIDSGELIFYFDQNGSIEVKAGHDYYFTIADVLGTGTLAYARDTGGGYSTVYVPFTLNKGELLKVTVSAISGGKGLTLR